MCSTHKKHDQYIKKLIRKIMKRRIAWKTTCKRKDNIKTDQKKYGVESHFAKDAIP